MTNQRIDALKRALEMEKDGKAYYENALAKADNALARKIFTSLIKAEDRHMQKIKQLFNSLQETGQWPEVALVREQKEMAANIFAAAMAGLDERNKGTLSEIGALKMAAEMEEESMRYYQSRAGDTDDPFEKKFYHLLVHEESDHYISLLDAIEFLEDPQGYFSQRERGTMSF